MVKKNKKLTEKEEWIEAIFVLSAATILVWFFFTGVISFINNYGRIGGIVGFIGTIYMIYYVVRLYRGN